MDIKHNVPLLMALAIPVLMILFVAGAIYLPALWAPEPQHAFLYAVGSYPTHTVPSGEIFVEYTYTVSDGKLTQHSRPLPPSSRDAYYPPLPNGGRQEPRFYVHDTIENASREVTPADAQALPLEVEQSSPDGYEVARGGGGGGWPFGGGGDYNKWFLRGHGVSEELAVKTGTGDYYRGDGFTFIGWVVE